MKTFFLTVVMTFASLVSFSQKAEKLFAKDAPSRRWFAVVGDDYAGVMFFQDKSHEYIVKYLTEMLLEDSIRFDRPMEEVFFDPDVYLLRWEYVQLENKRTTYVTYTKEERYSMITFEEGEEVVAEE